MNPIASWCFTYEATFVVHGTLTTTVLSHLSPRRGHNTTGSDAEYPSSVALPLKKKNVKLKLCSEFSVIIAVYYLSKEVSSNLQPQLPW